MVATGFNCSDPMLTSLLTLSALRVQSLGPKGLGTTGLLFEVSGRAPFDGQRCRRSFGSCYPGRWNGHGEPATPSNTALP